MNPQVRDTGTREKILQAGAEAIAAKSFNSCGLTEILERAGVPKGSFYHYFQSKEDFGVALIESEAAKFLEEFQPIAGDRRLEPLARLRSVFDTMLCQCAREGAGRQCLIPKLALETSQLSEPVHAAVQAAYAQWTRLLAGLLREAQAAGQVDPARDPDRLASLLVTLWEGATIRAQVDRSPRPIEDFMSFVFGELLPVRA